MLMDGRELAGFIKERQAKQVRQLRGKKIWPKLAIVLPNDSLPSLTYSQLKQKYGQDIGVAVDIHQVDARGIKAKIKELNQDQTVQGIIVQLPLPAGADTQTVLDLVVTHKDVDGLAAGSKFEPATPTAILWLLSGHNIELAGKNIALIGKGRLVGQPLYKILSRTHKNVSAYDKHTKDLDNKIRQADIIISAAGQASLIKPSWVKPGAVVVDAGTASEDGKLAGDADPALYERDDIKISPVRGGVGPLTVCALFDNVILACQD